MDARADGNDEKSTTTFRCINVARYALASVVTVLIAAVVVNAIKTVVRPDTLILKVVGGSISVERPPGAPPNQLQVVFTIRAENPSGRVIMYYYNAMSYLFDKNISASTRNPLDDSFVALGIADKAVPQQEAWNSITQIPVGPDEMTPSYFDMLYNNRNARIDDVTMRVDGYLLTEPISGYNTTARWTTYYCSPLVVSWASATTRGGQDDDEVNKNTEGSVLCAGGT